MTKLIKWMIRVAILGESKNWLFYKIKRPKKPENANINLVDGGQYIKNTFFDIVKKALKYVTLYKYKNM